MNSPDPSPDLSSPFSVRPCRTEDKSQVLALIQPYVEEQKILPRTIDELRELLPHAFVADADGQIVGFVALEVYSQKLAEIRSLVVDPTWQGRGVGKMLVRACVERAKALGIFEVMAVTSAEPFMRSCGFDFTLPGERKAFFLQTREHH